jgi:uncharacterized membrane protein
MDEPTSNATTIVALKPQLLNWVRIIYALHTLSILIGVFTAISIAGAFVFEIPSIIAVIMNYLKRDDAQGTWLESHFRWQIRTFWIALIALFLIWLVFFPLSLILIGLPFLIGGRLLVGLWVIYRVAKGWMKLVDGQPLPKGGA